MRFTPVSLLVCVSMLTHGAEADMKVVPNLPEEVGGKTILVLGWIAADPLALHPGEASHERAIGMLREAGAVVVTELVEGVDYVVVGLTPMAYPEQPDDDELDPVVITEYAKEKHAYDQWIEKASETAKRAEAGGAARVVEVAWFVRRAHPEMPEAEWRVRRAMVVRVPTWFEDPPLAKVFGYIGGVTGAEVKVAWDRLPKALHRRTIVPPEHPLLTPHELLDSLLVKHLGPEKAWSIDGQGVLHIPAQEQAETDTESDAGARGGG